MNFKKHSIKQLTSDLQNRKISVKEINTFGQDAFQAYECFDERVMQKQISESEIRIAQGKARPLEGIPVGIKDIINTEDYPTQMGSPIWKNFTPGNDARCVFNLKRNGAIIAGKTITAEFAVHALGKTLNPYDVKRNPGTSSSGSAVAVATGQLPCSIGTQTGGSIIRPASYCGVYGCKPSFGLIPRTGILKTCDTMDTVGFFVNYAEDLKIILDALRVSGNNYPISAMGVIDGKMRIAMTRAYQCGYKVGIVKTHTFEYAEPYAREELLRRGEVVELPKIMESCHDVHSVIYDKSLSHYFRNEYKQKTLVSPIMNEIIERGQKISYKKYIEALKAQETIIHAMDEMFNNYDILISLSTAGVAPLRDESEKPDPCLMWTMAHLPVVNVPRWHDSLPFGIQVIAKKYNDFLLFDYVGRMEI